MLFRMSWLLCMLIYLSVNGQVFATPVHLCQTMAQSYITSISPSDPLKVHEHHHMEEQTVSDDGVQNKMKNCQCVDCDCTPNMVAQANSSLISNINIVVYLPNIEHVICKKEHNFISQPDSSLYRPPIFS